MPYTCKNCGEPVEQSTHAINSEYIWFHSETGSTLCGNHGKQAVPDL